MNNQELDAWEETLEIFNDSEMLQAIREADEELANGEMFSFEQVFGHAQPDTP